MAHTVGIILSVVMVFTAGLVTFLFGAMTMSLAILNERGTASAPGGSFAIPLAIISIGLGGWGVATGVAIVKMKEWARISMLALGAVLFVIVVFGALEMAHDPHVGVTYAWVRRKAWSLSEPGARLILPVLVTEFCLEDLSFLACSIDLQRNENDEKPEIVRLIHIEKDPGNRRGSEEVDRVANSRIEAVSDEGLSLRADRERAT
jgi:hypothetical protein